MQKIFCNINDMLYFSCIYLTQNMTNNRFLRLENNL